MKIFRLKSKQASRGFTIIELLVAMGLFIVFMVIASGTFIRALRTQRAIVALIAANDNVSLSMEQMAREIRTGTSFSLSGNDLSFVNAAGVGVTYRLNPSTNAIEKEKAGANFVPITATNVKVNSLNFYLSGQLANDGLQSRITIVLSASPNVPSVLNSNINLQTTISARTLEN